MKRPSGILLNSILTLSLMLWIATVAAWMLSERKDGVMYSWSAKGNTGYLLWFLYGEIELQRHTNMKPVSASFVGEIAVARPVPAGEWGAMGIHISDDDLTKQVWDPVKQTYHQVNGSYGRTRYWTVSFWWPFLITGLLSAFGLKRTIGWHRQRKLRRINHCAKCGYDLRATPDRCPECGTVRSEAKP